MMATQEDFLPQFAGHTKSVMQKASDKNWKGSHSLNTNMPLLVDSLKKNSPLNFKAGKKKPLLGNDD